LGIAGEAMRSGAFIKSPNKVVIGKLIK
jgi:hypothetical protein